jgi:hypothetical protein
MDLRDPHGRFSTPNIIHTEGDSEGWSYEDSLEGVPFGFYDSGLGDVAGWSMPSDADPLAPWVAQQVGGPMPPLFQALS